MPAAGRSRCGQADGAVSWYAPSSTNAWGARSPAREDEQSRRARDLDNLPLAGLFRHGMG